MADTYAEFVQMMREQGAANNGPSIELAVMTGPKSCKIEAVKVDVITKISYMSGYSWSSLKDAVTAKISEYLKSLASEWADGDISTKTTVYIAKLQAAVLDVLTICFLELSADRVVLAFVSSPFS